MLVIEPIIGQPNQPSPPCAYDMIMFANYTGHIRTRDEFSALLAAARFRMARVLATTSALSILEARPA